MTLAMTKGCAAHRRLLKMCTLHRSLTTIYLRQQHPQHPPALRKARMTMAAYRIAAVPAATARVAAIEIAAMAVEVALDMVVDMAVKPEVALGVAAAAKRTQMKGVAQDMTRALAPMRTARRHLRSMVGTGEKAGAQVRGSGIHNRSKAQMPAGTQIQKRRRKSCVQYVNCAKARELLRCFTMKNGSCTSARARI